MVVLGYALAALFSGLSVTGMVAWIWSMVFFVRMTFPFQDKRVAYSRDTLWNPMSAVLRPSLLSEAGQRSRKLALRGVLVFLSACFGGRCFALAANIFR